MKIIYLHQYFKTPEEGGGIRSYYLAKALIEAGFEVEMITTQNEKKYEIKNIEGIVVHYLPISYDNTFGFWQRIAAFLAFIRKSFFVALKLSKHRAVLCYATSTPLTVGIIAMLLKFFRRVPYYFEVRDLWPLAPIQMGYIRNPLLKHFLYFIEKKIYQSAEKIVTLSPEMVKWIARSTIRKPIFLIPNMADCKWFEDTNIALQTSPDFTIAYTGTLGEANYLESFVEVAAYFQEKQVNNVKFLIVGKGKAESVLKELANKYQLNNLQFLPHTHKTEIRKILHSSQAVYVSFAPFPVLQTTSPNKFFEGLAAGKLIITNTEGWMKDLTETNQCGFYANTPELFFEKIMPFVDDKNLLLTWQKNAAELAKNQFDRKLLTQRFVALFPGKPEQ